LPISSALLILFALSIIELLAVSAFGIAYNADSLCFLYLFNFGSAFVSDPKRKAYHCTVFATFTSFLILFLQVKTPKYL
jgi:hypothetical protein